jgi:hypothetical protein
MWQKEATNLTAHDANHWRWGFCGRRVCFWVGRAKSPEDALIYAVAAGTATTLRPGTALCEKDDFLRLVPQIKLQKVEE